jgi:apolipoprotein N-acyltransferase
VAGRKRERRIRVLLSVLSGAMLGFSFPPSPLGVLACFGLVPLLIVLADLDAIGRQLRYGYVAMLVFHVITLNWTGGYAHMNDPYMMIAGAATMIVHPLFYFLPLGAYGFIRRNLGDTVGVIALPFLWVAYEYTHALSEWSFPWITIGNSQSYDLAGIQFISTTGVYGLSLWILLVNVLVFVLYSVLARKTWKPGDARSVGLTVVILVIYFLPKLHGTAVLSDAPSAADGLEPGQPTITVGIIQSNVDPWEKWNQTGFRVAEMYFSMTASLLGDTTKRRPDLVLWPETAMPYYFLNEADTTFLHFMKTEVDRLGVPVLTGFPQREFYEDSTRAPRGAKRDRLSRRRYDAFNAAALLQPGVDGIPWYGKMKMVPLAERIPYAEAFYFFDFLRWDIGVGGWTIGRDSVIFEERRTGARFNTLICYESVYPDLVAAFVRKGAEFITLITIDSWWGRMSGAFQHQRFSIFRAIENRRWIARCAVGGISCCIDPFGRVYDPTELFTQTILARTIGRSKDMSFYTEHGDWLAGGCLFAAGMFVAAAVGQKFKNKKRQQSWNS